MQDISLFDSLNVLCTLMSSMFHTMMLAAACQGVLGAQEIVAVPIVLARSEEFRFVRVWVGDYADNIL
jgi:alkyl hydroperoxide reductase subunit AhpF